jgi:Tfp pilus assembly protein PilF
VAAPLFALGLALALPTVFLEKEHVGARGPEWDLSAVERVLIAGRALWFYAGKLLWPEPLIFIYPRWDLRADVWWQYLFPLAALGVLLGLFAFRRRLGRGPLTAVLFFCGTLVPALGFFDVYPMRYSFVADHFQYLASAGLLALLAAGLAWALANRPPATRRAAAAAGVVLLGLLGALTWRQAEAYHDAITLWTDTLAKDPECWMAYTNRGNAYVGAGRLSQALDDSTRAVELSPDRAKARHNRALVYVHLGQLGPALDDCNRAIELDPGLAKAYGTRGEIYLRLGQLPQALDDCTRAIELRPDQPEPYNNRGLVHVRMGKMQEAEEDFTRAIRLAPDLAEPYSNRGDLYLTLGRPEVAVRDYDRVLELSSETAGVRSRRGTANVLAGRLDRAAEDFDRALALEPNAAAPYLGRALLHYTLKEYAEAWADVKRGQERGGTPNPRFLRALGEASGQAPGDGH